MTQAFEQGNRRAEVAELEVADLPLFSRFKYLVTFQKLSGNVRRSKYGVWKVFVESEQHARWLAERWINKRKLGLPVLKGV